MRAKLAFAWQWSATATLPIALFFLYWAFGTFQQWKSFTVDYDTRPAVLTLHQAGVDRFRNLARNARLAISPDSLALVPEDLALRTVQLFIGDRQLSQLNNRLPYSGYEFVDGQLMFPDGLHEVNVRYRGDYLLHWGFEKKSFRVRSKNKELFDGLQTFNLIVPKFPEQVNNYLGYRLANHLGLMAPRCELVNVMQNGSNLGMYEFTEQIDEGTLRRYGQAVGEIFVGDLVAKSSLKGITNHVFELPETWEQLVDTKGRIPGSHAPLDHLARILAGSPSEESMAQLAELLDMDAFGAFGAFEILTQTHHFDECHNWRLAWNPWTQKFRPIIWDPTPWNPELRPAEGSAIALDLVVSRLGIWLYRNGDFLTARHKSICEFFTHGKAEQFLHEADAALTKASNALDYDPNIRPTLPADIRAGMVSFRAFIERTFHDVRLAYVEAAGTVRCASLPDQSGIALEVHGRSPVEAVLLRCNQQVQRPTRVVLRHLRNGKRVETDLTGATIAQNNTLRIPARMLCQLAPCFRFIVGQPIRQHTLNEQPGYYELILDDLSAMQVVDILVLRGNEEKRTEACPAIEPSDLRWLYQSTPPHPNRVPQVWRGTIVIQGVREIRDDVVIEPGTVIQMSPEASLIFRGRVDASGTTEQPIQFVPAIPGGTAWGCMALAGNGCNGSRFRHCDWRGGSSAAIGLHQFPAMFAVHDCADAELRDCRLLANTAATCMVHLAHSSVKFDGVEWQNSSADALHSELSQLQLTDCQIRGAGENGISLTASSAILCDSDLANAKDTAIVVSAGSSLIAVRTKVRRSNKGVLVRDESYADFVNCDFLACQQPLLALHKDWRHPGGAQVSIRKSLFSNNKSLPNAEGNSRILVQDCTLDAQDQPAVDITKKRKDNHAQFVDCDGGRTPRKLTPIEILPQFDALLPLARNIWTSVCADVRGSNRE